METNKLSGNYNAKLLIKYSLPTIIMMIFMSMYTIADGVFVSNFVNETALSAVNIVFPIMSINLAVGLMMASGASASIGKLMGEGNNDKARSFFTLIYFVGAATGIVLNIIVLIFPEPLLIFLGADEQIMPYAMDYTMSLIPFFPMLFMQIFAQFFFVTAGKPMLGFISSAIGGVTNIVLDYLLIYWLDMGITGAAIATGIGYSLPGIFGVIYFCVKKKDMLRFVKPGWDGKLLFKTMTNGMSELVSNISVSITTFMFNVILMNLAGPSGVAAITVILYVQMIQTALFAGYAFGISPIISFKYGEQNHAQLKKINSVSFKFFIVISVFTIIFSQVIADTAVAAFISPDSETFAMATNGFRIFSIAYAFMGFNIFFSSMFTALSNGLISGTLAVTRSLVFIVAALLLLPEMFGLTGVWLSVPVAEFLALFVAVLFYRKYKKVYHY